MEYELVDTGRFDDGRSFDAMVEYAKVEPEDLLIRTSVSNGGPEAAPMHVLPTPWFAIVGDGAATIVVPRSPRRSRSNVHC
jgi:hypothetical protein